MTANLGGLVEGDLPWLEARRGGHRVWVDGTPQSSTPDFGFSRPSLTSHTPERDDDFDALKAAALEGVAQHRRRHTVVLPGAEVRTPSAALCTLVVSWGGGGEGVWYGGMWWRLSPPGMYGQADLGP